MLTPLYPITSAPAAAALLSDEYAKTSPDKQLATELLAEQLLDLTPGYVGGDAERLALAVALQINFLLARKITPAILKTAANQKTGMNETYRDRWVTPDAAAIVASVTGRRQVRFAPTTAGV